MPRPSVRLSLDDFRRDRQGRTFSDVLNDPHIPFGDLVEFFNDAERQRRMEDSEIHHDRPAFAGVVREFEALPAVRSFFFSQEPARTKRLRQAVGVLVRIVMERRGWRKTGRKGSLGVRSAARPESRGPRHNTGGLALWFLRAERYAHENGMPFSSVRERTREIESSPRPSRG